MNPFEAERLSNLLEAEAEAASACLKAVRALYDSAETEGRSQQAIDVFEKLVEEYEAKATDAWKRYHASY